jgi:hypothetical protein
MKLTTRRVKAGIVAIAVTTALLPLGGYAQSGGPTATQLLSLIQQQQKQLNDMKTALKKAQAQAEKAT